MMTHPDPYYRWQVSANLSLTPDFQIVTGADGRRSRATQAIMGIRMFFGF